MGEAMNAFRTVVLGVVFLTVVASQSHAQLNLFSPLDAILGGRSDGANFVVGAAGTDGGNTVYTDNVWPAGESPDHAIDGVGQKYLNFAELNTGFIVRPTLGSGIGGTIVKGMKLWTANDAESRDPASYQLYGTNTPVSGAGPFPLSNFTLISSGALALPSTRNDGGLSPLSEANSQTLTLANSTPYSAYLLLFPSVKNEPADNSMQIAEVQLTGTLVPEPGSLMFVGLGALGLLRRTRR
jgi:hypothetical protein